MTDPYLMVGAICFDQDSDGVGIPVFDKNMNSVFIPETDWGLRIVEFHPFYNEENYLIDFEVGEIYRSKSYKIRDNVPIPFRYNGTLNIIDSNVSSEKFMSMYDAEIKSPVVFEVLEILVQAEKERKYSNVRKDFEQIEHGQETFDKLMDFIDFGLSQAPPFVSPRVRRVFGDQNKGNRALVTLINRQRVRIEKSFSLHGEKLLGPLYKALSTAVHFHPRLSVSYSRSRARQSTVTGKIVFRKTKSKPLR